MPVLDGRGPHPLLLLACLAPTLLAACGQKHTPTEATWSTEHATHSGSDTSARGIPPLDLDEARARFAKAEKAAELVVLANRIVHADGTLSDDERLSVIHAVDALRADQLPDVWDELDPVWPSALVAFRRALMAQHEGDPTAALDWLAKADGDPTVGPQIPALRARLEARLEVDPQTIAVLLPLSGRYGRIGAELRAGIRLAAAQAARGAKLVFVDTEGDEHAAAAAVEEAVYERHAAAILGPVGMRESAAAAARAAELGIPIALLSPDHHGAAPDVGVFRLWSSPGWEAAEAVRIADDLGYDRLAILAPRDEQGALQIDAFREAARREGSRLVAVGQYDPSATDLEPDIKEFLGLDPKTNRRLARHLRRHGVKKGWKTFSPEVEFDLLFLPDDYQRAALVAAFLPYFNVELRSQDVIDIVYLKRKHGGRVPQVVQLLGSSGWHHPGLIPRGGQLLEGALLLDVYSGGDDEEFATQGGVGFANTFQQRFGRPASAAAAQAHDAAMLLFAARERAASRGERLRDRLPREILRTRLEEGACGPAAVAASGEIVREAVVLRVDGGQFVVHQR